MLQVQEPFTEERALGVFKQVYNKTTPLGGVLSLTPHDESEWDLKAVYRPNWACAWNNPKLIMEPCTIVAKDSKIAIVQFIAHDIGAMLPLVYRLEDLEQIKIKKYDRLVQGTV